MNLQATIKNYKIDKGHAKYIIEIQDLITGDNWFFSRRYSVLRSWHTLIKSTLKSSPNFPPRKFFCNLNMKFLEKRMLLLGEYLKNLISFKDCPVIKDFLKPYDRIEGIYSIIIKESIAKKAEDEVFQKGNRKLLEKNDGNTIGKKEILCFNKGNEEMCEDLKGEGVLVEFGKGLPVGGDENMQVFFQDSALEGHWVRKKWRSIYKDLKVAWGNLQKSELS